MQEETIEEKKSEGMIIGTLQDEYMAGADVRTERIEKLLDGTSSLFGKLPIRAQEEVILITDSEIRPLFDVKKFKKMNQNCRRNIPCTSIFNFYAFHHSRKCFYTELQNISSSSMAIRIEPSTLNFNYKLGNKYKLRVFEHKKNKPTEGHTIRFKHHANDSFLDRNLRKLFSFRPFKSTDNEGNIIRRSGEPHYLYFEKSTNGILEIRMVKIRSKLTPPKCVKYYKMETRKVLLNLRLKGEGVSKNMTNLREFLEEYARSFVSLGHNQFVLRDPVSPITEVNYEGVDIYRFTWYGDMLKRGQNMKVFYLISGFEAIKEFICSLPSASERLLGIFSEGNQEISDVKMNKKLSKNGLIFFNIYLVYHNPITLKYEPWIIIIKSEIDSVTDKVDFQIFKEVSLLASKRKIRSLSIYEKIDLISVVVRGKEGRYNFNLDYRYIYRLNGGVTPELLCLTNLGLVNFVKDEDGKKKMYLSQEKMIYQLIVDKPPQKMDE